MTNHPPDRVVEGFGAYGEPEPTGPVWDDGVRYGDVVVSQVADAQRAAWSAKVREVLGGYGVTVAKPVRTSDGRHVLGGWQARQWAPGAVSARADEAVVASIRLEEELAGLERPRFLSRSADEPFGICDRAVWAEDPASELERVLDMSSVPTSHAAESLSMAAQLTRLRGELLEDTHWQVCHGDPVATMLFDGSVAPVVTDIVPRWAPAGWTPALATVDSLAWGLSDEGLPDRFDHLRNWNQLLVRAVLYRLFVHAVHPDADEGSWAGLARAAELIRSRFE